MGSRHRPAACEPGCERDRRRPHHQHAHGDEPGGRGAIVMGVGMGLFEETIYDPRNGHPINDNFADYIVPTIADAPQIDVHFLDIPDPLLNEYGARGIGEIGLAGIAPAITAAVYHATGVRVRELPVRIEDLMKTNAVT
jgi:xanthine dehydrogenase YagR molybdenum-binding subunit